MTKRLLLMRHGEAQAASPNGDKGRSLTRKGLNDMRLLHAHLLADGLMPEFALASDARRTQETVDEVTGHDFSGTLALSSDLYNASAEKIIDAAQMLDDQYRTTLIVAHNPGIYQAVMDLVKPVDQPALNQRLGHNYKSGTLTVLDCPIERWADLKPGANLALRVFVPE